MNAILSGRTNFVGGVSSGAVVVMGRGGHITIFSKR